MTTKKSKSSKTTQHTSVDAFHAVRHLPSYDDRVVAIGKWLTQEVKEPKDAKKLGPKEKEAKRTVYDTNGKYPQSTDLLVRLVKYGLCSKEVFTVMVVLLRRLKKRFLGKLTKNNVYKCTVIAFITAAKLRDDSHYTLKYYSQITGLSVSQLFLLEMAFLKHVSWDLAVSQETYERTAFAFEKYAAPVQDEAQPVLAAAKTKKKSIRRSATSRGHAMPRKDSPAPMSASHLSITHLLQDHAVYI